MTGILYIVPTPIGNLEDITLRAIRILKEVSLIAAEDTRNSSKLLRNYQIETPMISYHKFNERARVEQILDHLRNGEDVAVISDSGTPGISDPAQIIIREAISNQIKVETLPGATAFVPALISSGLKCDYFFFVGFLPDKKKDRSAILEEASYLSSSIVFYEAPHRLIKFLQNLKTYFGNRKIVIGREISKIYETYYRSTISEFLENPAVIKLKGEFTIIVEGKHPIEISDNEIKQMLNDLLQIEIPLSIAVKKVSENTGISKNRVYNLALKLMKSN